MGGSPRSDKKPGPSYEEWEVTARSRTPANDPVGIDHVLNVFEAGVIVCEVPVEVCDGVLCGQDVRWAHKDGVAIVIEKLSERFPLGWRVPHLVRVPRISRPQERQQQAGSEEHRLTDLLDRLERGG